MIHFVVPICCFKPLFQRFVPQICDIPSSEIRGKTSTMSRSSEVKRGQLILPEENMGKRRLVEDSTSIKKENTQNETDSREPKSIPLRRSTRQAVAKKHENIGGFLDEESVKVGNRRTIIRKSKRQPQEAAKPNDEAKNNNKDTKSLKEECETSTVTNLSDVRASSHVKNVGAHVSVSGGLHRAIQNALDIHAKAFGLFLRNQRQWNAKPLDEDDADLFKKACKDANFSPDVILPHGIYLMNCASPNEETLAKSRAALTDELKRCEKLGLILYNFHPGSTCSEISKEEGIKRIAKSINDAHKETKYVVTLIENMCCQGHTIGGKFEELKSIIDEVENKSRIGVCFDTCHAFAAGYDISSKEAFNHTMDMFDEIIGLEYLRAVHLNDSKGECECHLDRHENIGHGKIGLRGFKALMNDARLNGIPMILETPETDYSKEINKLYSMVAQK